MPIYHDGENCWLSIVATKPQIGDDTQLRLDHVVGGALSGENRELLRTFNPILLANENQENGGGNDDN
jgi:hypothetical protein